MRQLRLALWAFWKLAAAILRKRLVQSLPRRVNTFTTASFRWTLDTVTVELDFMDPYHRRPFGTVSTEVADAGSMKPGNGGDHLGQLT
jgi:hypothetical protein